ncbi:uncharacterized protein LOC114351393 [Ostrinia furnacalis]|uniref:uncharacterized protein LOC114351393 n=1 Tax=Ostrinia furnacalis TaxID=93504 RepID=UPI00103F7F50|nr:uncharacterized protein LOC114351393 [Ostrinia furnacalis]
MLKLAAVLAWCITMIATADSAPSSNGWPYNARNYNIYYGRSSWPQPLTREAWWPSKIYASRSHGQNGVPYSWGLLRTGESMWPSKTYETRSHGPNGVSNSRPQTPTPVNWSPTPLPLSDFVYNDDCPIGKIKIGEKCHELESGSEEVDYDNQ